MGSELFISEGPAGCSVALLRDKILVEVHEESDKVTHSVGDIYLGTVRRITDGLNAAFVDVGFERDAFLHASGLDGRAPSIGRYVSQVLSKGTAVRTQNFRNSEGISKEEKIGSVLSLGQRILVQVEKEPISKKGPRVSMDLSLAGRYIILTPFSNKVNISKNIQNLKERDRLTQLVRSLCPKNFGIIIRTAALDVSAADLHGDIDDQVKRWEHGVGLLAQMKHGVGKIIGEMDRPYTFLRDFLNDSFDGIYTDTQGTYEEVRRYIRTFSPEKEKLVKLHKGTGNLFRSHGIERQIKTSFGRVVALPGGSSLVIEHTEALHVIDVNSGKQSKGEDQEENALKVNMTAIPEIVRQIRLRNLGGIIVVDFIDLKSPENKVAVYRKMKDCMALDRTRSTVLPLTRFGLMQITRHRKRPELSISTDEKCPSCMGTGKVVASIGVAENIEKTLHTLLVEEKKKVQRLAVHPYLRAYFLQGVVSPRLRWFFRYRCWIRIKEDAAIGITEYRIENAKGEALEGSGVVASLGEGASVAPPRVGYAAP